MLLLIFSLLFLSVAGSNFNLDAQEWSFFNESISGVAFVPGDIYSDLYRNKLISNPYYADNDIRLKWVARNNWTYKSTLNLPQDVINQWNLIFLNFGGVDGISDIYLDGNLLGESDNRFRGYIFNVTSIIKQSSTLELRFPPIVKEAGRLFRNYKVKKRWKIE